MKNIDYAGFVQIVIDSVIDVCRKMINRASFDVTKRGFVTDVNEKIYVVKIGNEAYNIKSDATYSVGDTVLVLFPQNNPNDKYIIGKAVK